MSMKQRLGSIIWICSRQASQQLAAPFDRGFSPGPARVLDVGRGAKFSALLLDLHRQLPRRRQHQHNRPVARRCAAQQV